MGRALHEESASKDPHIGSDSRWGHLDVHAENLSASQEQREASRKRFRTNVLSDADRSAILASKGSHSELARRFDVTEGAIRYVRRTREVNTASLDLGAHAPLVSLTDPAGAKAYLADRSKVDDAGCWIWLGWKDRQGYGHAYAGGAPVQAHRLSRLAFFGAFDYRLVVRHTCNVRACVNPIHLELGTQADNIADAVKLGRHPHGVTHGRYRGPGGMVTTPAPAVSR